MESIAPGPDLMLDCVCSVVSLLFKRGLMRSNPSSFLLPPPNELKSGQKLEVVQQQS